MNQLGVPMSPKKYPALKLAVIALLLVGCATVPITGRRQLDLIPQDQIIASSFESYKQVLAESKISTNQKYVASLNRVGRNIATAAEQFMRENKMSSQLQYYKWEFKVIEADSVVNAWCMPGGKVAVYTGIMPLCPDETGLAVVVGHEVAHALANHGSERMSQSLLAELGGMTLAVAMRNKPQETQSLAMAAYGAGATLGVLLPFSRTHESEADHIGLILMARAGYDPRLAVPFWQRMAQMGGAKPPEFLSTHPADERRIRDIEKEMPEALKYYNP
jgi:predicted Zn-dependent protease